MPILFHVDTTLDSLAGSTVLPPLTLPPVIGKWIWNPVIKKDSISNLQETPSEFNVMPFSFTNTPMTFQCLMECTLAGLVGYQCLIYLDYVIIFSSTFSDHLRYLAIVFVRLKAAGLKSKANKCYYFIHIGINYISWSNYLQQRNWIRHT